MVKEIKTEDFENEVMNHKGKVLLKFYGDACVPCTMLAPIFDKFAEENPDIKCVAMNAMDEYQIAGRFNVMSVPTTIAIDSGVAVNQFLGMYPKETLEKAFN